MKAALISLGSQSSKWTAEAMRKYFKSVDELNLKKIEVNLGRVHEIYYEGKKIKNYDCVLVKGSFRYAQLLQSISSYLEDKTYLPIDPEAFTIVHDKLHTHLILQKHNIPMPKTYVSSTPAAAKQLLGKVNYPIIMKFPKGTGGKGVMYAESFAAASSMLDALTALKQPFIIQEYIETGGTDIRAIVIGDRVVASMRRKAAQDEKRANLHSGGIGEAYELDNYTKKIAVKTAKALGAEICAVDMLEDAKGPLVIEANLAPGLQGIIKATKVDVADKIAKHLFNKTKERKEKSKEKGTNEIFHHLGIEKGICKTEDKKVIITNLDFRGNRILLPEFIANITRFKEEEDVSIEVCDGKLEIKRWNMNGK